MKRILLPTLLLAAAAAAGTAAAQPRVMVGQAFSGDDRDRAMIGVSTSTTGRRDTLGLYISSVTASGPAEKAGIEEGNRLVSINGVSLKLARDDAGDPDMGNIAQNRLIRELRKVKAGDEVSLEVYGGGRTRPIRVKTVSADELSPARTLLSRQTANDRAAIGVFLSTTGSKRDTAGVFVSMVVEGGPAEKAGLAEGDRIASINGVDVRVSREDAGDATVASSRIDRFEREVHKLKAGDVADLTVISGGRSRTVKVTTIKESDLPGNAYGFRFNNGDFRWVGPMPRPGAVMVRPKISTTLPSRVRIFDRCCDDFDGKFDFNFDKFNFDGYNGFNSEEFRSQMDRLRDELKRIGPDIRMQIRDQVPRAMDEAQFRLNDEMPRIMDKINDELRDKLPRALEKANDQLQYELPRALDKARRSVDELKLDVPPPPPAKVVRRVIL